MFNTHAKLQRNNQSSRILLIPVMIFILLIFANRSSMAGSATLSWTAPTTNVDGTPLIDLAGYKVYFGTTSKVYGSSIDIGLSAGNPPTYTINNLGTGTYFFAVTAYDSTGIESSFSNESSKTFAAIGGSAPPPSSNNLTSQQTTTAGGCGMVSPKDRKTSNPGQAADMLVIIALLIVALFGKALRKGGVKLPHLSSRIALLFTFTGLILLYGCGDVGSGTSSPGTTNLGIAGLNWVAPTTNTDGTPLTNLTGYKVYFGKSSGNYGTPIDVGNTTSYSITGLTSGTYFFVVTAYDTQGIESSFSNQASKTIN